MKIIICDLCGKPGKISYAINKTYFDTNRNPMSCVAFADKINYEFCDDCNILFCDFLNGKTKNTIHEISDGNCGICDGYGFANV